MGDVYKAYPTVHYATPKQNGTLQDLMEHCDRSGQPLPEGRLVQLMIALCRALSAMHAQDLAHRDVKVLQLYTHIYIGYHVYQINSSLPICY